MHLTRKTADMEPVLDIRNLSVTFSTEDGDVRAVKSASMQVGAGETIAIVGESGSGKSQSMMAAMGLSGQGMEKPRAKCSIAGKIFWDCPRT